MPFDIGRPKTHGDWYRMRAAEFHAKANEEETYLSRAELERLALAYSRLAEHADGKGTTDTVHETPRRRTIQQQQQVPPNSTDN